MRTCAPQRRSGDRRATKISPHDRRIMQYSPKHRQLDRSVQISTKSCPYSTRFYDYDIHDGYAASKRGCAGCPMPPCLATPEHQLRDGPLLLHRGVRLLLCQLACKRYSCFVDCLRESTNSRLLKPGGFDLAWIRWHLLPWPLLATWQPVHER